MTVVRHVSLMFMLVFADVDATCPPGALQGLTANDCYLYLPPNFWLSAVEDCVERGGQLASVTNAFVNLFLPTLPKETCGKPYSADVHSYWLGGSVGLTSSSWAWSDGSPFTYTAWDNGQPSTTSPRCLAISLVDARWSADDCMTQKPYVCRIPPATEVPTSSCPPPPKCPPPAKCSPSCPSGWTYYAPTNKCFKLAFNVNFNEALAACQSMGSTLASVHNGAENSFLTEMISQHQPPKANPDYWDDGCPEALIGLYDPLHNRQFRWTDDSPTDYTNWSPGNPDNWHGNQYCTRLISNCRQYTSFWDDIECDKTINHAICQVGAHV